MMNIEKYFSSSKKRDLSDNSKDDIDPKKAQDATSSSSYSNHIFEGGLDSSTLETLFLIAWKISKQNIWKQGYL